MFRSLLTAKTGMDAMQFNVDVISNNLANVSTTGFKRERPVFQDLLYQNLRQPGSEQCQCGGSVGDHDCHSASLRYAN